MYWLLAQSTHNTRSVLHYYTLGCCCTRMNFYQEATTAAADTAAALESSLKQKFSALTQKRAGELLSPITTFLRSWSVVQTFSCLKNYLNVRTNAKN